MSVRSYPYQGDLGRGAWTARLVGPHPKYRVEREFLRGVPVKSRGVVEFGFSDLGGAPGWVESCDLRGIRSVVRVEEIGWREVYRGPLSSSGLLRVVEGSELWGGDVCSFCAERDGSWGKPEPLFGGADICELCADEAATSDRTRAHLASLPDGEVF